MRFVRRVMRRGKIDNLNLTGRIPGRGRGRQREKHIDGMRRIIGS